MNRIASFEIDHTSLQPGMYVSRVDGDVVTYDLRFLRPNTPPFLENGALHTIEHLFATYVRNSAFREHIIYFGPMGCRTGFYFLTRDSLSREDAIRLTVAAVRFISGFKDEIPGTRPEECGHCREHDLSAAKRAAAGYLKILENWMPQMLNYS